MDEKKENYLKSYIPAPLSLYKTVKKSFGFLNEKATQDSNSITYCKNISADEFPYVVPRKKWGYKTNSGNYSECRGFFAFEDMLVIVYVNSNNNKLFLDILYENGAFVSLDLETADDGKQRSIVIFNVAKTGEGANEGNILETTYEKKLLVFPDKVSISFDKTTDEAVESITGMPNLKYAVVHNSRLFGVDDDKVYASAWNNYADWTLDTADVLDDDTGAITNFGYDENHAWCSTAQSNIKASGTFTGITSFSGHVVLFKRDYMQEVYGNSNPFRVMDIYADGAIDNRSIQVVGSQLFFCSEDYIKIYTGAEPKIVSYPLKIGRIKTAIAGTDNRKYYIFLTCENKEKHFFVYDTFSASWVEYDLPKENGAGIDILGFAHNSNGMYMVTADGNIIELDSEDSSVGVEWLFDTDLMLNGTVDVRHIQKIKIYVEMGPDSDMSIWTHYDGAYKDGTFTEDNEGNKIYGDRLIASLNRSSSNTYTKEAITYYINKNTANEGFKLRFQGNGYVKIYNIELIMRQGGDKIGTVT